MEPINSGMRFISPADLEPSESSSVESASTSALSRGPAPQRAPSSEQSEQPAATGTGSESKKAEHVFAEHIIKSQLNRALTSAAVYSSGQAQGNQTGQGTIPEDNLAFKQGSSDEESIYKAMLEMIRMGQEQRSDARANLEASGQQKLDAALQAIESKKQEIEQQRDSANDEFWSSLVSATASTVASTVVAYDPAGSTEGENGTPQRPEEASSETAPEEKGRIEGGERLLQSRD